MQESEVERRELSTGGEKPIAFTIVVSELKGQPDLLPVPPPPAAGGAKHESGQSAMSSVFTLCNSAIGAGVLSLPFAFVHSGLVGGLLLVATIGLAEGWTLYVLAKFAEAYNQMSFGLLVRRTLGRCLALTLAIVTVLYLFGSCTVYLLILGDTLSALGGKWLGVDSQLADRDTVIFWAALALLPLCLLRRLGHLSHLSALAVFGFIYTSCVVVGVGALKAYHRWPNPLQGVELFKLNIQALYAVPIITFGFNCHANVVTIFSELSKELDLTLPTVPKSNRHPSAFPFTPKIKTERMANMLGVITCSIMIIGIGYCSVGAMGYVGFPQSMGGNVLNSLPQDNLWVQGAQLLIALVVFLHFPISHHPARSGMLDIVMLCGSATEPPTWINVLFTIVYVGCAAALAMSVTSLGAALHIIGGTAAAAMIFAIPGGMLMNAGIMKASSALLDDRAADGILADGVSSDSPAIAETFQRPSVRRGLQGLSQPLLVRAAEKGITVTGFMHAPGKSWAAGLALVLLSLAIFIITMATL